jgi:hypothetical protein
MQRPVRWPFPGEVGLDRPQQHAEQRLARSQQRVRAGSWGRVELVRERRWSEKVWVPGGGGSQGRGDQSGSSAGT